MEKKKTAIRKCHLSSRLVIRHTWFTLLSLKDDQNNDNNTKPIQIKKETNHCFIAHHITIFMYWFSSCVYP